MGDPLIQVQAPIDSLQVVALMPNGEPKPLAYNPASGMWEARFDIPGYTTEGDYRITVIIVSKVGLRTAVTITYHVNLAAPKAMARAKLNNGTILNLEVQAEGHIA